MPLYLGREKIGDVSVIFQTGTPSCTDTTDATMDSGSQMLEGFTAYSNGQKYTGTIPRKAAATITPGRTDQTIAANQYLSGAQTIKGDGNLLPQNIISGVSIFGVAGSVVTQDYYVGDTDPSNTLGSDGDLYFKRG